MLNYYLFHCTDKTYNECISKGLFGETASMYNKIKTVQIGDILYLNFLPSQNDSRIFIEGPFKALSTVGIFDSNAWGGRFPSQIRVDTSLERKITYFPDYVSLFGKPDRGKYSYNFISIDRIKAEKLTNAFGIETDNNLKNFRRNYPADFRAEDGHIVRSLSEALIDNWLFNNNYLHCYEKKLPVKENVICDFYLKDKDIYIEFWGMKNDEYIQKKEQKLEIYKKNNLKLISLEINDIADIDSILPQKINALI
jgi:hypothetical protein